MTSIAPNRPAGHALVEALIAQGASTVFGVPGESFLAALQGRPGPVVLVLPEDMLATATSAPVLGRVEAALAAPAPEALLALQSKLAAAERPLVIAGGSGWTAAACDALERFAERWQLPVGCAFRVQDVFDNRHPNYAGDVGIGINPKLAARVRDADLIVAC